MVHVGMSTGVKVNLVAVLLAVEGRTAVVLTLQEGQILPSGPLQNDQKTLQGSMRAWVEHQTHHQLGHIEQLYTFMERSEEAAYPESILISYLGLTQIERSEKGWRDWYYYFPWEDQNSRAGQQLVHIIGEKLREKVCNPTLMDQDLWQRCMVTFGLDGKSWDEELVLQRYELLYQVGFIPESPSNKHSLYTVPGASMARDHRRILATGIARLRAKIRYKPVIFELMSENFTLLQLQEVVEAVSGRKIHKQNFRRILSQHDLVEETGEMATYNKGRPAQLFRFRRQVMEVRKVIGAKLPLAPSRR